MFGEWPVKPRDSPGITEENYDKHQSQVLVPRSVFELSAILTQVRSETTCLLHSKCYDFKKCFIILGGLPQFNSWHDYIKFNLEST